MEDNKNNVETQEQENRPAVAENTEMPEKEEKKDLTLQIEKLKSKLEVTKAQGKSTKSTLICVGVVLLAIIALFVQHRILAPKTADEPQQGTVVVVDIEALHETISPASKLVSYEYAYANATTYEDSKKLFGKFKVPFTTDKVVFVYEGKIHAGVELSKVDFEVNDATKTVKVILPGMQIVSHELLEDKFRIYDVKNSIFNSTNIKEYADMIAELKKEEEEKLIENADFWDGARQNTEYVLTTLLKGSDVIADYSLRFEWEKAQPAATQQTEAE